MIKEAYVSYEVAKLLKKKGFDESTLSFYIPFEGGEVKFKISSVETHYNTLNEYPWIIAAPTHQMAMLWLREKHKLFILVGWLPTQKEYFTRIFDMTDLTPKRNVHEHADYSEAVDEAIKYCLENLI